MYSQYRWMKYINPDRLFPISQCEYITSYSLSRSPTGSFLDLSERQNIDVY